MTNQEKIKYLNDIFYSKGMCSYSGPKTLFKYRPLDQHTFDMLKNNYVYLCPAELEDDETECLTTIDYERLYDLKTNNLKRECAEQIISLLKPYTNNDNYELIKNKVYGVMRKDGTIYPNFLLDIINDIQDLLTEEVDIALFVNWIINIPEFLDRPEISCQLDKLVSMAYNARKETGICALTEDGNNEYMWKNYAEDHSGCCIEYDIENYEHNIDLLPVIYEEKRETNILIQLIASLIGQLITGFSNGDIIADSSQFIGLFITKFKKWEYQKEWRIIGKANDKMKAPRIKCIYLGKNIKDENKKAIIQYAKEERIRVICK